MTGVGAVITAFHPGPTLALLVEVLRQGCDQVVVVDNSTDATRAAPATEEPGVSTLRTGGNLGLAAALNRGLDALRATGVDIAVLWDQDSLPAEDYLDEVLAAARSCPAWPRVVAAGQRRRAHGMAPGAQPRSVTRLITSGMTAPLAVFDDVGPFREEFFVDGVDTEFSLRARASGHTLLSVPGAVFAHGFGEPDRGRRVLWARTRTSGHPPWRQYWIARNEAVLLREYRRRDPEATRGISRDRRSWFLRALVGGPDRLATLRAVLTGFRDSRTGRVDPRYARARS